jgi:hypothetical protein
MRHVARSNLKAVKSQPRWVYIRAVIGRTPDFNFRFADLYSLSILFTPLCICYDLNLPSVSLF